MKKFVIAAVVLALLLVGLMFVFSGYRLRAVTAASPPVIFKTYDPTLEKYNIGWSKEVQRRFPNSVVVAVHGGEKIEGEWFVNTQPYQKRAAVLCREVQALYPDRTVVLIACNPGHLKLGVPGVFYATDSVWCVPDRALNKMHFLDEDNYASEKFAPWFPWQSKPKPVTDPIVPTIDPWPFLFPDTSKPKTDVKTVERPLTRWEREPGVVGNIFEFVTD